VTRRGVCVCVCHRSAEPPKGDEVVNPDDSGAEGQVQLVPPITRANNLLLGMTWVDTFGDMLVVNPTTGNYAALHAQQCGWFGGGQHKVAGTVYSADDEPKLAVCGKWSEQMSYMYVCRRLTPGQKNVA
jgi:hypothetical protein